MIARKQNHVPPLNLARAEKAFRQDIEIADLLGWAFRDQQADAVMQREALKMRGPRGARDSVDALRMVGELGVRVDGGGAGSDRIHPDAVEVWMAVSQRPADVAGLVTHHAKAGTEPMWPGDLDVRWIPTRDTRGRIMVHTMSDQNASDRERAWGFGKYVDIRLTPSPETIELVEWSYAVWNNEIAILANELSDKLKSFKPYRLTRRAWRA